MLESPTIGFLEHFKELYDPRQPWKITYPLPEILLLCLCAVVSGAEGWKDIALYGKSKVEFLRQFSAFEKGTPSEDTLSNVFSKLNPKAFQECFLKWTQDLQEAFPREVIAIDGKALRHSFDKAAQQSSLQMVSAWACQQELVLAQEAVHCKSNEITAIAKLLGMLVLKGAIVTIDAMGCQREIARQIVEKKADYVLALKGNQGTLNEDVRCFFEQQLKEGFRHSTVDYHQTFNKGHGRGEQRKYWSTADVAWLRERHAGWTKLNSIILVESCRTEREKRVTERRYYISSLPQEAQEAAKAIRGHWGIENKLHWVLDVVFREDDCRIRKDHAPRNFSIIRQIALNMIRKVKGKHSVRGFRKLVGWVDHTLFQILLPT